MRRQKLRGTKEGNENEHTRENPPGTDLNPMSVRPGNHSMVGGRLLFDAGSPELTPGTIKVLDAIARSIVGHTNIVLVKGHASLDDLPGSATAQNRMDLSLRRAQAASDYLMSKGVSPEVLRVQGCSTFEPVRERVYKPEGQLDNRRVEVESTTELVDERKDTLHSQPLRGDEESKEGVKQENEVP